MKVIYFEVFRLVFNRTLSIYTKQPRLAIGRFSNGQDHEPNTFGFGAPAVVSHIFLFVYLIKLPCENHVVCQLPVDQVPAGINDGVVGCGQAPSCLLTLLQHL